LEIVKVSWVINDFQKFLTGELIFEDSNLIKVRGLKDGTIFEISKKTILEIQRGAKNG
jgi:hypothetical protein